MSEPESMLEAARLAADDGFAWLAVALDALGVPNVFEIPDWKARLNRYCFNDPEAPRESDPGAIANRMKDYIAWMNRENN